MKVNEFIIAKTHAEFLNQLLNKNYKAFMKSGLSLDDGKWLWMIELSSKIGSSGWRNMLVENILTEEFLKNHFYYDRHNTYIGTKEDGILPQPWYPYRVVFNVMKFNGYRKYVFCGVFMIDESRCTAKKNVWVRIADEYKI